MTTAAGTTAAPNTTIQWANFLKASDNLHPQSSSPALGKGTASAVTPLKAVSGVNIRGLFTPTFTAPGADAGAYQASGTGNQQ